MKNGLNLLLVIGVH